MLIRPDRHIGAAWQLIRVSQDSRRTGDVRSHTTWSIARNSHGSLLILQLRGRMRSEDAWRPNQLVPEMSPGFQRAAVSHARLDCRRAGHAGVDAPGVAFGAKTDFLGIFLKWGLAVRLRVAILLLLRLSIMFAGADSPAR